MVYMLPMTTKIMLSTVDSLHVFNDLQDNVVYCGNGLYVSHVQLSVIQNQIYTLHILIYILRLDQHDLQTNRQQVSMTYKQIIGLV